MRQTNDVNVSPPRQRIYSARHSGQNRQMGHIWIQFDLYSSVRMHYPYVCIETHILKPNADVLISELHPDSSKRMTIEDTRKTFANHFDQADWTFMNHIDVHINATLFEEFAK